MKNKNIHEGNHFQKYLTTTPWYLISSLFTKAISFLLLPIYTKYLSPEEYGILANFDSFGRLIPIFLSLYLDAAFGRFYFKERKSNISIQRLYSSHFWFIVCWGGIVSLFIVMQAPYFFKNIMFSPFIPLVLVVITALLNQLSVMVTMIWRANLWARNLSLFQIMISIVGISLSIYLLVFKNMGWQSRIIGSSISSFLQLIFLLIFVIKKRWLAFIVDIQMLKRSLIFSIPLIPNIAAGWIAGFSDRMILAHYGMLDQAGLYSIAAALTYTLYIANDSITQVQGPIALSALTEKDKTAKTQMQDFLVIFFGIMSIMYLIIATFSKEIIVVFSEKRYHDAYKVVMILGPIYVFSGVYRVFTNIISYHGKNWIISSAAILQSIVNLILNFIFIPLFGMYAAASSSLFSMIIYTLWIVINSQRLDPIKIPFKQLSILSILIFLIPILTLCFELVFGGLNLILIKILTISLSIIFTYHVIKNYLPKDLFILIKSNIGMK